jgi:adenosylcobinamide kinase/adenosylcobinamide-phosphate guanylyltransferase
MAHVSGGPPGLTFITGGARSGKSAYAVELATRLNAPTLYLATAEAGDPEMRQRIRRHRAGRPRTWRTLEERLDLARAIASEAARGSVVIVDCLTVWLSNVLQSETEDAADPTSGQVRRTRHRALDELESLCTVPIERGVRLLVVSNEVGSGLVPPYPLGRVYRDLLGEVNQFVARRADEVTMLVAGIPIDLKALGGTTRS